MPWGAGCGVVALWTGAAARGCAAGVHRVVRPAVKDAPARLAVWAELSTRGQLLPSLVFTAHGGGQFAPPRWARAPGSGARVIRVTNLHGRELLLRVGEGELLKALHAVEEYFGLPFVKIVFEAEADADGLVTPWEPSWRALISEPPP